MRKINVASVVLLLKELNKGNDSMEWKCGRSKDTHYLHYIKKEKDTCLMYYVFFAITSKDDDDVILLFIERIFHRQSWIVLNFQKYIFTCFTPGNFSPLKDTADKGINILLTSKKKNSFSPLMFLCNSLLLFL